jgi:hypothetical protein
VLEEAAHHAAHAHVLGEPRHAGAQAADAAHEQVDLRAGARGVVERIDHRRVLEAVHLDRDLAVGRGRLLPDLLEQPGAQPVGRDEQLAVCAADPEAGQVVEQLADVRADLGRRGEEADVLVHARRLGVVVAGADVAVAADAVVLAPHHEHHLAVRLQADEPVDDVAARGLERARPFDVRLLVEARLDLDERHHLLAVLRSLDQRAEHAVVAHGGAVERVLDREHVGVARRLLEERLDGGAKGVVRMVHHHVAGAEHGEEVRLRLAPEPRLRGGLPRRVLQVRAVDGVELPERAERERAALQVHVALREVEPLGEELDDLRQRIRLDLEPHGVVHAQPAVQTRFDGHEQVVRLALVDQQLRVARHAERPAADDAGAREEQVEVRRDQPLERQQPPVAEVDEAREDRRHLHAREVALAGGVVHEHREVQRQVRDPRERVGRVDRERRQRRMDAALVLVAQALLLLFVERIPVDEADALGGEARQQLLGVHALLPAQQLLDVEADLGELLGGAAPVGRRGEHAGVDLRLEAGHAHLEELVEVARGDGEELHALEQRELGLLGQREHARVEAEPGELAVQEAVGRGRIRRLLLGLAGHVGLDGASG